VLGTDSASLDAELLALLMSTLGQMQLKSLELQLNSLGCAHCRPQHQQQLVSFLAGHKAGLCPDCQRRANTNPLRVFDCKRTTCQGVLASAPQSLASICPACRQHFDQLRELLNSLDIGFKLNPQLVRGLDYYTRTAFEIVSSELGAQNAVAGGGRFDGLVEQLGGPPTPAFGFAIGLERLALLLQKQPPDIKESPWVYLALLGEEAQRKGLILQHRLRSLGITTQMDYSDQGLKKQLKLAHKLGAPLVVIMGEDELKTQRVILRDMLQGTQEDVPLEQLTDTLKSLIGGNLGRSIG
jgi:histidyl-tRNA synthetase